MNNKTADEEPKKKTAERVITPKRKYFFPGAGRQVEADTLAEAEAKVSDDAQENDK